MLIIRASGSRAEARLTRNGRGSPLKPDPHGTAVAVGLAALPTGRCRGRGMVRLQSMLACNQFARLNPVCEWGFSPNAVRSRRVAQSSSETVTRTAACPLQDVAREIIVAGDVRKRCIDELCIDGDVLAGSPRGLERDFVEQPFHHRIQPSRADVLLLLVDGESDLGQSSYSSGLELEVNLLGCKERRVLPRQAGVGRRQDFLKIGNRERRGAERG